MERPLWQVERPLQIVERPLYILDKLELGHVGSRASAPNFGASALNLRHFTFSKHYFPAAQSVRSKLWSARSEVSTIAFIKFMRLPDSERPLQILERPL